MKQQATATTAARPMPELAGVEHRHMVVRGGTPQEVRLHLAEAGHGRPVVLLHGYLQHWYVWRQLLPLMGDGFRLICVDLRGWGWSEQTRRGYDNENLADDLAALLAKLGLTRSLVIGDGIGGGVALRLAQRDPTPVAGLLALAINHPAAPIRQIARNLWRMWYTAFLEYPIAGRLMLRHAPGFTQFLLRHATADRTAWPAEDLEEFVQASRSSAHAGQQVLWQVVVKDMPNLLSRTQPPSLAVPTLILGGEKDPIVPPELLIAAAGCELPVQTRVLDGCGHHLPVEAPHAVAAAAREFFATIPAGELE